MTNSTSSHPPTGIAHHPDPTSNAPPPAHSQETGGFPPTSSTSAPELARLKIKLQKSLRQFPDFPCPGVLFEDILPLFADPTLHQQLIRALELHVILSRGETQKPDVIVGLDARGFLFGPSLALQLGAGFVPVRKTGKLPGPTESAAFKKEYGEESFQIQKDGIKQGQRVLVVDDIIATGGSAEAAGKLVRKLGGILLGYVFILELDFLKGRDRLDAPVYTLLSSQEEALSSKDAIQIASKTS